MKDENRTRRALALGLAALLLLILVLILLVGDCAHPFGDDLVLSGDVHRAWEEGSSVPGALAGTVKNYYLGWDGSYTTIALSALQPGLLSEGAYILTPILLAGGLCLSAAALTHALLRRWLKLDLWTWLAVTSALVSVLLLYQPSPRDAFFLWFSGVSGTGSSILALLLAVCLVRLRLEPRHPRLLLAAALLLAALLGGGCYLTALPALAAAVGYALVCALRDRRRLWQALPVCAVLLAGFLANVLSPGSRVFGAPGGGLSPARSVYMSLQLTFPNVQWMLHLPLIALLVGVVPVLRRIPERTGFAFPLPGLVTAAAVFLLLLQNAAAMYVVGINLTGQALNSVFDAVPWLLLATEGYWAGWFGRRRAAAPPRPSSGGEVKAALLIAAMGLILSAAGSTAGRCMQILADGSARAYDTGVNAWVEVLSDPDADPVVLPQLPDYPLLLCSYVLEDNPEIYANVAAALYYGKTAVTAVPPEPA